MPKTTIQSSTASPIILNYPVHEFILDVAARFVHTPLEYSSKFPYTTISRKRSKAASKQSILHVVLEQWGTPELICTKRPGLKIRVLAVPWYRDDSLLDWCSLQQYGEAKLRQAREVEGPAKWGGKDDGLKSMLRSWMRRDVRMIVTYAMCLLCQELAEEHSGGSGGVTDDQLRKLFFHIAKI
jgi:hypothetical protein